VSRAYVLSQRVLGGLLCLVGLAIVVSALARGGGPFALGTVVGILFAALGAARVWLARGREVEAER
jgi:hypothetical protein